MTTQTAVTAPGARVGVRGIRLVTASAAAGVVDTVAWVTGLADWPSNFDVAESEAEVETSYSAHQAAALTQFLPVEGLAGLAVSTAIACQ